MTVGVLSIQGSFKEHLNALLRLGVKIKEIRLPDDLIGVSGLIIPGGESTTMATLLKEYKLDQEIIKMAKSGMPIYGTCAGLILLAKNIDYGLKLMDVEVTRNAYGRQLDSFVVSIDFLNRKKIEAIFIRAPKIKKIEKNVEVLASYQKNIVMVRQNNLIGSSFHPELTKDLTIYEYFLKMVKLNQFQLK